MNVVSRLESLCIWVRVFVCLGACLFFCAWVCAHWDIMQGYILQLSWTFLWTDCTDIHSTYGKLTLLTQTLLQLVCPGLPPFKKPNMQGLALQGGQRAGAQLVGGRAAHQGAEQLR